MTERLAARWRMVAVDRPCNGHSTRDPDAPAAFIDAAAADCHVQGRTAAAQG